MGLKDTVRNGFINAIVGATNYTANTNVYVSLHTADPGNTGASEVSTTSTGYARVNGTTKFAAAASGSSSNNATLQFPTATASWSTVSYVGLWDAASAGNFLGGGALSASKPIGINDTASFASGNLTLSIS